MKGKLLFVALCALLASSALAVGQQAVVAFDFVCNGSKTGPCPDGASPNALIQGSDGNFYGTAANSGDKAGGFTRFSGTVFSLTPAGKFTLLHTFVPGTNNKFANRAGPVSLTEGPDGKLYGITVEGGNNPGITGFFGYGVLFRINKTGSGFQVIHRFCSIRPYCGDGFNPAGPLVAGTDGNVYGATSQGGTGSGCSQPACGTIFRVTPSSGAYEVVFSFSSSNGGGFPSGQTPAADGTFYGVTSEGGSLFHYTPVTGTLQTTALPFPFPSGCAGLACFATTVLTFGPNGNLYGFYTVYDSSATGLYEVGTDGSNLQLSPLFLPASVRNCCWPAMAIFGFPKVPAATA